MIDFMSKEEHPNETIKRLIEENAKLKRQIEQLSIKDESIDKKLTKDYDNVLLSDAYQITQIGYWNYSFKDNTITCSDSLLQLLELTTQDELTDFETIKKLLHPEERNKLKLFYNQLMQNGENIHFVFHIVVHDGSSRYIEVKAKSKQDGTNSSIIAYGTALDITERYYKNKKIIENEHLFHNLFNNLTDIFIIFELIRGQDGMVVDYRYKEVNPAYEMKFGLKKSEIVNKKLSSQPKIFQQFNQFLKVTAITGEPQQDRFFVESLDSFADILIYAPSEKIVAMVWRDVSLMVKADRSLRESEEKYRQIFAIENDGLLMIDFHSGKIMEVNPSGCKMFGYRKEELLQLTFREISNEPELIEQMIRADKASKITGNYIKKDGTLLPIEASLSYFNWGGRKVVVVSLRDISERLNAQKELIKSEKRYRHLFNYSNDAILIFKDYKIIDFNQKSMSVFGTDETNLKNKTLWNISPLSQKNGDESRLKAVDYMQQVLQGKKLQLEWTFQNEDKGTFHADLKLSPIFFENEKVIQAIVRDISPKKELEEALILNETRWKYSLQISYTGVWDWNVITNEVYYSATWKKIIGYEKDEIQNKYDEFEKRVHPDDIANVYNKIEAYFSAKSTDFNVNFRFRCKNGSYKWINSRGKIYSYNQAGKPERFIGTHTDITRYIVDQQNLAKENNRYLEASKTLKMGFWDLDLKNMILTGTNETLAIFGFENAKHATLKQIENLVHPEDQNTFISQFISKKNEGTNNYTFRILVDSQTRFILSQSRSVRDSKNRLTGFSGVFQDITSFKKQELQLKDEQKLINSYIEKTQQTIIIIQDQDIVYTNEKFTELTGYNIDEFKSNTISFFDLVTPEDKTLTLSLYDNVSNQNKSKEKLDIRIETKHNRIKWVEVVFSLIQFNGRNANLLILSDISKRKKTEIQLFESEQRLKKIVLKSPIGIATFNLSQKLTSANPEFMALTGISDKTLTKTELRQLFDNNYFYDIKNAISNIIDGKISDYRTEILLVNQVCITLSIFPSFDSNNDIFDFILYLENIDLAKKQIDLLTEENYIQKAIMENTLAGVGVFNEKGELTIHNKALFKVFNIDPFEKTSITFEDLNISRNYKTLTFESVFNDSEKFQFEQKLLPQKTIFIDIKPIDLLSSKSILLLTRDISEITNKTEKLIKQLQEYQTIFEQSPAGIALIDKNRNIVFCNLKYANTLGLTIDRLNNMKLDQLIQTESLSELMTNFSELFAGVISSFDQLTPMGSDNGGKKWISSKVSHFTDRFNEVAYAIQVIDDVTKAKEDEYKVIKNERLKTLNHIANSFAHVFNNLLMAIYGNSYLLKSNLKDESLTKYADDLFCSLLKASDQTHKLLSFSRNRSRMKVVTNIKQLVDKIIENKKDTAEIKVTTQFEANNEHILGDPSQLQSALQNIIDNAYEAMPLGGELLIETKSVYFDTDANKGPADLEKGKYLRINISNNGEGIKSENLSKIFDPFFSTKSKSLNAGLGLTIALKIILEHKGTIKVDSQPKQGSTFSVYLPEYDDEYLETSIQPDEQIIIKGTANLMIIDDEDVVRIVTAELLRKLGYNVFSFASGKKAIQFYQENKQNINLILLDKHMPEMDGTEVFQKLKEINKMVKVILLTGFNIDDELEKTFKRPNSIIIQKPVSIEKLSYAISDLLLNTN